MEMLEELVYRFREVMENTRNNGDFRNISPFHIFPKGCCDLTCDLLAHYLANYDIETYQVNGQCWDEYEECPQNHVWLVLSKSDLIIDITGDQFKNNPFFYNFDKKVHIGTEENMHKKFTKRANESNTSLEGIDTVRRNTLNRAYDIIKKQL